MGIKQEETANIKLNSVCVCLRAFEFVYLCARVLVCLCVQETICHSAESSVICDVHAGWGPTLSGIDQYLFQLTACSCRSPPPWNKLGLKITQKTPGSIGILRKKTRLIETWLCFKIKLEARVHPPKGIRSDQLIRAFPCFE